jgi:hypothetical protein
MLGPVRCNLVEVNVAPTIIEGVDDQGLFASGPNLPVRSEPGNCVLQAYPLPAGSTGGADVDQVILKGAPCKCRFVSAHHPDPLGRDWKPFIGCIDTIAGGTVTPPAK